MKALQTRKDLLQEVKHNARKRRWKVIKNFLFDFVLIAIFGAVVGYMVAVWLCGYDVLVWMF